MADAVHFFTGRPLIIATRHRKESVIAPLLKQQLGITPFVPEAFDTDRWGTFTGEVERTDDPISTARHKCQAAMQQFRCDLGVASEGSFGPHPGLFFINADEEILIFIDELHQLEIIHREISTETNFNAREITSVEQLTAFACRALFPSHALILRPEKGSSQGILKGLTDWETLQFSYEQLMSQYGSVYAETDMRAMYNPSRMRVIEQATMKLIEKINKQCPVCGTPGFTVTASTPGLPCTLCQSPTRSVLSHLYTCQKCHHSLEKKFPNNQFTEDPMYCDQCNP